ncbi:MAG TPA: hypothetical protein VIJ94_00945 [Caulobacteraceae bacterium]
MKLDRNLNSDGGGKYALVLMRRVREIEAAAEGPNARGSDVSRAAIVRHALEVLQGAGILDDGAAGSEREFFVIRLRDRYAGVALHAYRVEVQFRDPEYGEDILDMEKRSGELSPYCKTPD